ncbi:MAG: glucose-6-phosphate isomerase [Elusimicrobia bacterium]|nr:glucose-6-phosphate isomerase [Elusimicrobiota bacterium]
MRQPQSLASIHKQIKESRFVERLWAKDPSLWTSDPKRQKLIKNRLGWLFAPDWTRRNMAEIYSFVTQVKEEGLTHAILLGMGGSSLASEVLREIFGVLRGSLNLSVLDSTDPAVILQKERQVDLDKTLFIVSTKSGTTTETLSFYKYFYERLEKSKGDKRGKNFIAITDAGTSLEKEAVQKGFRKIFLNPADIGGRYSALSYFGMVPAALMGIQLGTLLDRTDRMVKACQNPSPMENPGVALGASLAAWVLEGRDKLTFVISPSMVPFGAWVEQLLAESTGKEGKGIVPIEGEELGPPELYGEDRVFVYLKFLPSPDPGQEKALEDLESAGHPVIRFSLEALSDITAEFFRWEVATVVAGALLKIDAFDEPNVQESKELTKKLLQDFSRLKVWSDPDPGDWRACLEQIKEGDYLALLAYLPRTPSIDTRLQRLRMELQKMKAATTLGYGPRYLHSTGQLHKGGKNDGIFIMLTAQDKDDVAVPGTDYSFGILKKAQALGDFMALRNKGRRVAWLNLGQDVESALASLNSKIGEVGCSQTKKIW